jgi:hypothetical protein
MTVDCRNRFILMPLIKMYPDTAAARILSFLNSTLSWDVTPLQSGKRLSTLVGIHFHLRVQKQAENLRDLSNVLSVLTENVHNLST